VSGDNWRHRAQGMTCGACMWWVPKAPVDVHAEAKPDRRLGRCRRHAPTLGGWPALWDGDWCGDHKLDENKA
jgi:hypothetical protein